MFIIFNEAVAKAMREVPSKSKELTLTATADNSSVALKKVGTVNNTYEYKLNNGAWTSYTLTTSGVVIPLNAGDKIQWRCTNRPTTFRPSVCVQFVMTGKIEASNPVTSMVLYALDPSSLGGYQYACYALFRDCTALIKAPELPAATLTTACYLNMFSGCTSLTQAPVLPATTLASLCYQGMFQGCTSLTQAPALPSTTLARSCYYQMFQGCTSLTQAPALPATALGDACYGHMFQGCTSLTQAPALPALSIPDSSLNGTAVFGCYVSMFEGCTSLVQAPALPATTLGGACYGHMFYGCTSLVQAPALPATTLTFYCYAGMFVGCTSLNEIRVSATDVSANRCTMNWTSNVSTTGDFWCDPNVTWATGVSGIPQGWTRHDIADYPQT